MSIDRRMLMRGALACACCFKAGAAIAAEVPASGGKEPGGKAATHWSYEGEGGPEKWGELQADFRMCQLGMEQTPIDLSNGIKGDVGSVDYDYKPLPLRVVNNGHTIQVNADPGSACMIGGTRFELLQFHLHHPSEHLLAGKNFDLECHFVHKAGTGALAVTGVFIRPGAANAAMKAFFESMPAKEGPEVRAGSTIDIAAMLPKNGGYFRYMGSLTTPPCSEGLTWTVHKEPIEVSVEQIQKFATLFPKSARPVQKRNRRFLIDAS
jgi:carbonic anhydrase